MTGIEILREYANYGALYEHCKQVTKMLGKSCCDFENCDDCHRFVCEVIADQIERETLPRPCFEDGEPVQVGDKYVNKYGNIATADTVVVSNHGFTLYDKGSATHFKPTESVKRPEPPKVLDADGVEIKVGDEVWLVEGDADAWVVKSMDGDRVEMTGGVGWYCNAPCSKLTHKRPEPEDTWERVEADAAKNDVCDYFGRDGNQPTSKRCEGCRGQEREDCIMAMTSDLVRRCKALAGVE